MAWISDTCECQLEFTRGGNDPAFFSHVSKKCSAHKNKTDIEIKDAVFNENQGKNRAIKKLIEALPELSITTEDGHVIEDLSKISWEYDVNRKITFKCKGINNDKNKRNSLAKAEVEKVLGAGKCDVIAL